MQNASMHFMYSFCVGSSRAALIFRLEATQQTHICNGLGELDAFMLIHQLTYEMGLSQGAIWHILYKEQLCLSHVEEPRSVAISLAFSSVSDFYKKL